MSNGQLANTVHLNGLDGPEWHLEGVGKFAGHAGSDLLWINNTTGAVNIWEVSGSKVSEIPVSAPTGNPLTLKAGTQSSQSADNSASSDFYFTSEGAGISVSFAQPQASFVVTTVGSTSHPLAGT
jgi:hypothetical protein